MPKQNAANSGKGNLAALGGCAFRYSAIVTEYALFHPAISLGAHTASTASVVTCRPLLHSPSQQKKEQNLEPCHNLTLEIASGHCVWKPSSSDLFLVTG